MASARGGMKDFYKQRKNSGVSKVSKPSSRKTKSRANSATLDSDGVQPAALISHGSLDLRDAFGSLMAGYLCTLCFINFYELHFVLDDYGESENILRQFDMNMAYGPCLGMTRMERWELARKLGLNPPKEIETLLKGGKVQLECLWASRI